MNLLNYEPKIYFFIFQPEKKLQDNYFRPRKLVYQTFNVYFFSKKKESSI